MFSIVLEEIFKGVLTNGPASLGKKFTKKICGKGKFQVISSMSGMLLKIKLNMKALKNAKKGFHIILLQLHICENNIFNILFKDTLKAPDDF